MSIEREKKREWCRSRRGEMVESEGGGGGIDEQQRNRSESKEKAVKSRCKQAANHHLVIGSPLNSSMKGNLGEW